MSRRLVPRSENRSGPSPVSTRDRLTHSCGALPLGPGSGTFRAPMAQNSQSATAPRASVPGTANDAPVAPPLFTTASKREYIPDAKRLKESFATPEMAQSRALFDDGDYARARAEARRVLKLKDAPAEAKMEAQDLIDRTDIDHGPIATAVALLILFGLMLMFFATNGK